MPAATQACKICETRRPRRYCPGVGGDICPVCCGTEREVTVNCPLSCEYLQEARRREPAREVDPRRIPNSDIKVDEAFLRKNEPLLIMLASSIARNGIQAGDVYDSDVQEALSGLVRTYRTLHSGLIYDSRPENPVAGRVYAGVQETVDDVRRRLGEHSASVRDADILGVLAFLERLGIQHSNGRPKGRAFLHFLTQFFPSQNPEPSGLIQTP